MLVSSTGRRALLQTVRYASSSSSVTPAASTQIPVSLSNIEASWKGLTPTEQEQTFKALEELQKKDWKELSIDEKKAAHFVAFGPHGPREPILAPGSGAKTVGGTLVGVAVASVIFYFIRRGGQEKPKTLTREWQEAATERAVEQRQDPFTGPSSEGYKGKGYVQNA